MDQPLIIYHADCQDGFGAAFAAWKKYGQNAEYLPAAHGDEPPNVENREVYILDYAYNRDVILKLKKSAEKVTIIDHHISAEKDLEGLDDTIFDMTKSGARLAWEYFQPDTEIPDLILNIEDRDLWKWQIDGSREITVAIETQGFDFDLWDSWLKTDLSQLRSDGQAILNYQKQIIQRLVNHAGSINIAGFDVPIVNCPFLSSEIGNVLCQGKPFAAVWRQVNGKRVFSLRSSEKGEDVSAIASLFGGGGHKRAAGFTVEIDSDLSSARLS